MNNLSDQARCRRLKAARSLVFFLFVSVGPTAFAAEDLVSVQADFLRGDYRAVVSRTQHLLEQNQPERKDELLYLLGVSAFKIRNMELARASLGQLVTDFPHSPWSEEASLVLVELKLIQDKGALRTSPEANSFFSIQVGAFEVQENALRLKAELERGGFQAALSEIATNGQPLYRVRMGPFADRQRVEEEAQRLKQKGFPSKIVP